ncbi:MAG TPA: hypothetical protein VFN54_04275, partial [Acidimicrobiales bacterium]|nr:hypothetical protein [Acidimicrobiales bacterium]
MTGTYLVTVSGLDRVGVGAELFYALSSLEERGASLRDVAQITIRGSLVLCAEIACGESLDVVDIHAALAARDITGAGITVAVEAVVESQAAAGRLLLVTLLAPAISADQLSAVFSQIAAAAATCERIVHLASYPVDCYELVVRGEDHDALRLGLTDAAAAVGLDLAVQRAGLHRRAKHLVVMDA